MPELVAVILSDAGNQTEEITGAPPMKIGAPSPFRMAARLISLRKARK
jgi:hypothetical protein